MAWHACTVYATAARWMIVAEMGRFGRAAVVKGPLTKGGKVGGWVVYVY